MVSNRAPAKVIPVVDVFAGPGGLGEGFSSYRSPGGESVFGLAVSIEKDAHAHETLRLRAFWRQFEGRELPETYELLLQGKADWTVLKSACPAAAAVAESEALQLTLAPDPMVIASVRRTIDSRVSDYDPWILVGGPPCQAYSLVGRARNSGKEGYDRDTDHRQTLYVEYLQILADHAPALFVMENVKGLLSAEHRNLPLFDRIREDLSHPAGAIAREGRRARRKGVRYSLHSLVVSRDNGQLSPTDFIIRSEHYGIPQKRHRVIIVGVREGSSIGLGRLRPDGLMTVKQRLGKFPRLRSGLSSSDSLANWREALAVFGDRRWLQRQPVQLRKSIQEAIEHVQTADLDRGRDYSRRRTGVVLNHQSRGHIAEDLGRYLFASAWAQQYGKSPTLNDFPRELLPAHRNVDRALAGGLFSDRFRVQVANDASTTVTSHISKDGHYFIHYDPAQCRSLTVREAAALQTFPDDYFFCGPRTSQYVQAGNAVPPELARRIAELLAKAFGRA